VNQSSAADTKDGSACQSVPSLEIRINAVDWIMLVRFCYGKKFDGMWGCVFSGVTAYISADMYKLQHQFATCKTKLHGVTNWMTLPIKFSLFQFGTLRTR
jgi:hypothetical protein